MRIPSIDEMPLLATQLRKARVDRIRYADKASGERLYKSQNIPNTILRFMQDREPYAPECWVDDVIQGIARLDHQQTKGRSMPLSVTRLYNILQCVELLNTRELMSLMAVEARQAQKYLRACKLIIQIIEKQRSINEGTFNLP